MCSQVNEIHLSFGEKIGNEWIVRKKLGEGSCGVVFRVQSIDGKVKAAMKAEPFMQNKDDEILKMELYVLRKLQKSKHACHVYSAGKGANYSYIIMSLLGKELSDIRRRLPERKMSTASVLKIGIQCLQAIRDLHTTGFVHRDIKPTNFAMGHFDRNTVYIFDFGLARQIMLPDKNGQLKIREARRKVSFRGTVRYCSLNAHQYKEQGRHDDLWSLLYMLIELLTATLPWKGMARRDSARLKETTQDSTLLLGCPKSFFEILAHLKKLTYYDMPNYDLCRRLFIGDLISMHIKLSDPFEWNMKKTNFKADLGVKAEEDELAEIDKCPESDTSRVIDQAASPQSNLPDLDRQLSAFATANKLENTKDAHNRHETSAE